MEPSANTALARRARFLRGSAVVALLLAIPGLLFADAALESIDVRPEGRLLRIDLKGDAPLARYTLSRQGPPEKRDLVVRLPGFVSRAPAADTGDYVMPIEVATESDASREAGIKVTIGMVGDALVQVAQDGTTLSILVIPPQTRTARGNAYRIGAGDMLQIDVFGHEDLNKTLKVSPTGMINVPLIGSVNVEGRTVDEVAQEITQRLEENYLREPHVTVSIWEYLSQWVNVIGEVAQPGRYYLTGTTTLIDAISLAGGLTKGAGDEILITRSPEQVDPSSAGEVFHVAIARLFSSEGAGLNMTLRPGDIVNVLGVVAPGGGGRAERP
jgi:polysaccharide export outer membrane protein